MRKIDDMKLATALAENSGNVSRTAEDMMLSRQAIYDKLGDADFRQTYNAIRLALLSDDLDTLRSCRSEAIDTIYCIMNDDDTQTGLRLKAASELLHQCRQEEKLMHELEVDMIADQKESAMDILGWSIAKSFKP